MLDTNHATPWDARAVVPWERGRLALRGIRAAATPPRASQPSGRADRALWGRARRGGRRRRCAQSLPPTSRGPGSPLRSADRRYDDGRVRGAAPGHRAPAVAGPAHAGSVLDNDPRHVGGARPRCRRADRMGGGARGRRLHPAVLPGGPAPRSRGTRGRRHDSGGSGPRVGRPPRHRRAPARVHAVGELRRRMPAQPGQDPGRRCDRGRCAGGGLVVADRRGAHRGRRGVDLPHENRDRHRPAYDEPDPPRRVGRGGDVRCRSRRSRGRRRPGDARAARLVLDRGQPDDSLRIPRGHARRAGLRRRGARAARGPADHRRARPRRPLCPRRRAGRPVAHRCVLASAAQRIRRRGWPAGAAARRGPPADPRRSSGRTATLWR